MLKNFLKIFKKEYQTLNRIEILRENLLDNYRVLSSGLKIKIAPVVKSNAYGHGIIEVTKILSKSDVPGKIPFLCVDSLFEAYELLKANIKLPILIMGYTNPQNFKVKKLPFSYAVFDTSILEILNKYQPGCGIHIFLDTGMHREGITLGQLPQFLVQFKNYPNLKVEGVMSHFACANRRDDYLNKIQIRNFQKALEIVKLSGFKPKWIHIANSDGLINFEKDLKFTNMARIGLALYGTYPNSNLKPVLNLKTQLIQIKKITKGERVGYEGTYFAKKDATIGILPLGYYDGVDRGLSNKGIVKIAGLECPIIGKVSMNITTIDLSKLKDPKVGQEVLIYSDNPEDKNSIENTARICKKIPYEILINLAQSTKRVII